MDWNPADAWDKTAAYLRSVPPNLPTRPQAIVLVTAHWLGAQPCHELCRPAGHAVRLRLSAAHL